MMKISFQTRDKKQFSVICIKRFFFSAKCSLISQNPSIFFRLSVLNFGRVQFSRQFGPLPFTRCVTDVSACSKGKRLENSLEVHRGDWFPADYLCSRIFCATAVSGSSYRFPLFLTFFAMATARPTVSVYQFDSPETPSKESVVLPYSCQAGETSSL